MLYVKNGVFRDSKQYLETPDGVIFNATPEQWEAEGWEVYVQPVQPVSEYKRTLEEKKLDLLEDSKNFYETVLDFPFSREERLHYRELVEDLLAEGLVEVPIFESREDSINLQEFLDYLKDLNVLEYTCMQVYRDHRKNIERLATEEDVNNYDYTTAYPEIPEI